MTWKVSGVLLLTDSSGKAIEGPDREGLIRALQVTLVPPLHRPVEERVRVDAPVDERDPPSLTYTIPNFGNTERTHSRQNAKWDYGTHEVRFSKPLEIRSWQGRTTAGEVTLTEPYLKPLQ